MSAVPEPVTAARVRTGFYIHPIDPPKSLVVAFPQSSGARRPESRCVGVKRAPDLDTGTVELGLFPLGSQLEMEWFAVPLDAVLHVSRSRR